VAVSVSAVVAVAGVCFFCRRRIINIRLFLINSSRTHYR
jgi:hypothetical protein